MDSTCLHPARRCGHSNQSHGGPKHGLLCFVHAKQLCWWCRRLSLRQSAPGGKRRNTHGHFPWVVTGTASVQHIHCPSTAPVLPRPISISFSFLTLTPATVQKRKVVAYTGIPCGVCPQPASLGTPARTTCPQLGAQFTPGSTFPFFNTRLQLNPSQT